MNSKKIEICGLIIFLGIWLLASPWTWGCTGRGVALSDYVAGAALILLALWALSSSWQLPGWLIAIVGLWLQFVPLIFWAPKPSCYLNDTLIGLLAIALAFQLAPPFSDKKAPDVPPGWSYNPSSWLQRLCTIGLGLICWFLSRYLAAYQLGYIGSVWDPFFGDGTLRVITSKISHEFPISDAGLGALGYSMEVIMGWQGDTRRWHTMPWLVLMFGVFVVPASLVSILLIILQPVAVGAWCGICLIIAVCMLLMILLTMGEVIACLEFLIESKAQGKSLWTTLWKGDLPIKKTQPKPQGRKSERNAWGITIPWNLALSALLGVWLMCSPAFFSTTGGIANSDYITGPILITISVVSMAEVARVGRFFNVLLGLWLLVAPWIFHHGVTAVYWNNCLIGLAVILLAIPKGKICEYYGGWNHYIR